MVRGNAFVDGFAINQVLITMFYLFTYLVSLPKNSVSYVLFLPAFYRFYKEAKLQNTLVTFLGSLFTDGARV